MRGATVGLIAAVLAVAGCKSTDPKDDRPSGEFFGRPKGTPVKGKEKDKDAKPAGTGLSWLDDGKLPGAGTAVPKSNPADPNAKADAQDALGGRVLDPLGRPARNVFVRIEPVGSSGAPVGIATNPEGYFFTRGLKPGQAYDLTAEATLDGKPLVGVVQTKVPNPILLIVLRDDLPSSGGAPAPKGSDAFPPTPQPSGAVPPLRPAAPKPNDNAWSPGGTISGVPPATIGSGTPPPKSPPTSGGALPPPADLTPSPVPGKPENVADAPRDPFKPPALNVPGGPAVPPLPPVPPSPGGRSSMGGGGMTPGSSAGKVALVDALERPWELSSAAPGSLVLVSFVTSDCEYSRAAVPVLRDVQSRYGAGGLQVAAVLCDDRPQKERAALASRYARDQNLNFATYVEPGEAGVVRDRFGVETYPTAFLLTPAGKVLWSGHPGERAQVDAAIRQNLGK